MQVSSLWQAGDGTSTCVSDLSQTGVYVHMTERFDVGSVLELRFEVFPDAPIAFAGQARVVRHGDRPAGLGLEFIDLDDAAKDIIHKILLRHEAQRGRNVAAEPPALLHAHGLELRVR